MVFFVVDIGTRRVNIAGITCQPCEVWMKQSARNLTDAFDDFLRGTRYLILDRDPLYTRAFRQVLKQAGIEVVKLPSQPHLHQVREPIAVHVVDMQRLEGIGMSLADVRVAELHRWQLGKYCRVPAHVESSSP